MDPCNNFVDLLYMLSIVFLVVAVVWYFKNNVSRAKENYRIGKGVNNSYGNFHHCRDEVRVNIYDERYTSQIHALQDHLEEAGRQIKSLDGKLQIETDKTSHYERSIAGLNEQIAMLTAELKKEKGEKEDATRRLSALMSSRLRDGNPNVVDLSDQNRPLKVGEKFSELYDNQWTDAFTDLQNRFSENGQDQRIVEILLGLLQDSYEVCKNRAKEQMQDLQKKVQSITGTVTKKQSRLSDDLLQRIKEERKMNALEHVPEYPEVFKQNMTTKLGIDHDVLGLPSVEAYVKECLKLCYLMVNQDPPMSLGATVDSKTVEHFKAYQTSGSKVAFVVWPALFLQDGGALVSKGVVEFHKV